MRIAIMFIIFGLIFVLIPKMQWYKNDIIKRNNSDLEEFLGTIRNGVGVAFLIFGFIALILSLVSLYHR